MKHELKKLQPGLYGFGPYVIEGDGYGWLWSHEDFDGAPYETGGPPADKRSGMGLTLQECVNQIEQMEDEA